MKTLKKSRKSVSNRYKIKFITDKKFKPTLLYVQIKFWPKKKKNSTFQIGLQL